MKLTKLFTSDFSRFVKYSSIFKITMIYESAVSEPEKSKWKFPLNVRKFDYRRVDR